MSGAVVLLTSGALVIHPAGSCAGRASTVPSGVLEGRSAGAGWVGTLLGPEGTGLACFFFTGRGAPAAGRGRCGAVRILRTAQWTRASLISVVMPSY